MVPPGDRRKFEINPMKNYATRPRDLKQRTHCVRELVPGGHVSGHPSEAESAAASMAA
jgi:hypothetical protein